MVSGDGPVGGRGLDALVQLQLNPTQLVQVSAEEVGGGEDRYVLEEAGPTVGC